MSKSLFDALIECFAMKTKKKRNKLIGFFRRVSALVLLIAIIAFLFYLAFPTLFQESVTPTMSPLAHKVVPSSVRIDSLADSTQLSRVDSKDSIRKSSKQLVDSTLAIDNEKVSETSKENLATNTKDTVRVESAVALVTKKAVSKKQVIKNKSFNKGGVYIRHSSKEVKLSRRLATLYNNRVASTTGANPIFIFSYKKNSSVLNLKFRSNYSQLKKMDRFMINNRTKILSGGSHLIVTAYLPSSEISNPRSINSQSINSNIIRTYIMNKYKIPVEHITFVFDELNNGLNSYDVGVSYMQTPISSTDNQKVYYTFSKNQSEIELSNLRYGKLPMVDSSRVINVNSALQEAIIDTVYVVKHSQDSIAKVSTDESIREAYMNSKNDSLFKKHQNFFERFFAVKSNLLYWAGAIPGIDNKHMTPNLELECFFAKRYSLNLNSVFAYWPDKKSKDLWGISTIAVEPRFWYTNDGFYRGLYVGPYGLYGDFDEKYENIADGISHTGTIMEAGLSLGYYFPVSKRLGFDLGVRCGYRSLKGSLYEFYKPDNYYKTGAFEEKGFKLTGLRFSVSYRIGKISKTK